MLYHPTGTAAPISTNPTQPAAAAAYGLNRLAFYDDFTSLSTIDVNNTLQPGFNWYVQMHEGIGNASATSSPGLPPGAGITTMNPSDVSISNSILTLNPSTVNQYGFLTQTGYVGGSGTRQVGSSINAGTNGAYWECRMAFDVSLAKSGGYGWPSFWAWDNQITLNNADSASYGGLRYTELDGVEPFPTGAGTVEMQFVDWDWPSTSGFVRNTNYTTTAPNLTDGLFHKYGFLYIPPSKNNGVGVIQRWIDGVHYTAQDVSFSPSIISPQANTGATTGWLSGYSNLGFSTMINTFYGWPIQVDWVQIWQA